MFKTIALAKLPINTGFNHNGHDMVKVAHPTLGFVCRTADNRTVVMTGKTPVKVPVCRSRPTKDIAALINDIKELRRKMD